MILVNRSTKQHKKRLGIVMAVDLEEYSFKHDEPSLIKATEETIIDGLPIDKGLLDDIEASLDKLKSNLEYAISRCNSEINVNNILYNTMLSREEKMLKTKNDDK